LEFLADRRAIGSVASVCRRLSVRNVGYCD